MPAEPTDWDRRYFELARHVAQWSKDPRTKVGAVIVGRWREEIALGYNGFPPKIADTEERLADRELKNLLTQHAERNVLDNVRFATRGATLATTRFPCVECAKSIVTRGIYKVVAPAVSADPAWTDPAWTKSTEMAESILREGGVEVKFLNLG